MIPCEKILQVESKIFSCKIPFFEKIEFENFVKREDNFQRNVFKIGFLENEASNEKMLFHIFPLVNYSFLFRICLELVKLPYELRR